MKRGPGRPRTRPRPSTKPPAPPPAPAGELRREVDALAGVEPPAPTTPTAPAPATPTALTQAEVWRAFGPQLAEITAPFYRAVGAMPLPVVVWEAFAANWGAVADYYMPVSDHPLKPAIASTLFVAAPLAFAIHARRQQLAEQKRRELQPPAPAAPDGPTAGDPAPPAPGSPDVRDVFAGGRAPGVAA